MELTPFTIYLVMQAQHFIVALGIAAIAGFVLIVGSIIMCQYPPEGTPKTRSQVRWAGIALASVGLIGALLIPSTRTLVAMFGIPAAIQVSDRVGLDDTAKKSIDAVNRLLDEYLAKKGE